MNTERIAAKLLRYSEVDPSTNCWIWMRCVVDSTGYGQSHDGTKAVSVHRLSWRAFRGPIPTGAFVLHECDNRRCINPAHLHLGDAQINLRECVDRGRHPKANNKTCPHGHALVGGNIHFETYKNGRRHRRCLICLRRTQKRTRNRRKGR